jgi:hypothetical protein
MYVVIAEDQSDVNCLKVLIKRLEKHKWIEKKLKIWEEDKKLEWIERRKEDWFNEKNFKKDIKQLYEDHRNILLEEYKKNSGVTVIGKGFDCCGNMLNKGAKFFQLHSNNKDTFKFIVCHDRDEKSQEEIYNKVVSEIIDNANIKSDKLICILIPTEEIEAWILADIHAVSKVITSWQPTEKFSSPETEPEPKEILRRLSRINKPKPLYSHNTHNEQVMKYIDLAIVKSKCPSFAVLANFVEKDIANYPK